MRFLNKKRLVVAAVVFAAVVAAIFTSSAVSEFLSGSESVNLKFQTGIEYTAELCDKNILLVNNEGIRSINKNGKEVWSIEDAATQPLVQAIGTDIMSAEINGKTVSVYKNEKLSLRFKTESEILSAKMNKNGYIAVAGSELGYKGLITVYDKNGRECFKWHSGSGYISDMDISPKNMLVISQVMTDKEAAYSKLLTVNTRKTEEARCIKELSGIGMKTVFREDGSIVALTDHGLYGFRKNGDERFFVDFKGRIPVGYNIDNENNMVIAFNDSINNTILESYSSNGVKRGTYEAKEEIKSFDVNGEYIVAAKLREVVRVNPAGVVKARFDISHDVKNVKIFPGRDKAIVISGKAADIIKIR